MKVEDDSGAVSELSEEEQFDFHARMAYEHLLILQPQFETGGLWKLGGRYFAVCPAADSPDSHADDGRPLREWFDRGCRPLGCPIELVASAPAESTPVAPRTQVERAQLHRSYRTVADTLADLYLALPPDFPEFDISSGLPPIVIVARPLDAEQAKVLTEVWATLLPGPNPVVQVKEDLARPTSRAARGPDGLSLVPSRLLPSSVGRALKDLIEEDEDLWLTERTALLSGDVPPPLSRFLPTKLRVPASSCLMNAAFPPPNIRTLLPVYGTVDLVIPLDTNLNANLSSLGISRSELIELARRDHVRLVAPQSPVRYDLKWMSELAESVPHRIILSRRLAALSISDIRHRVPLLFAPLELRQRHEVLRALDAVVRNPASAEPERLFAHALLKTLKTNWLQSEDLIHRRGAMVTSFLGLPMLVAELVRAFRNSDATLELASAGSHVEWAAALGASVLPTEMDGYSEEKGVELFASLYSGVRGAVPTVTPQQHRLIGDLLTLDNDAPVLEVAEAFAKGDASRLRELVARLVTENPDADSLQQATATFNAEVRKFEKRPERQKELSIASWLPAAAASAAAAAGGHPVVAAVLPLGNWLLRYLTAATRGEAVPLLPKLGAVHDRFAGSLAGVQRDAVLVARIRQRLK